KDTGIEGGGKLFTVGCSVNSDFKDLDEMTYIGFDEEEVLNYYATKPTDYQAYVSDPAVKEEYDSLWKTVDDVIGSIRILSAEPEDSEYNETGSIDAVDNTSKTASSDLYVIAGNSQFSFECVKDWYTYEQGDSVVAQKTEDSEVPYYSICPVTLEGTPGEEIVKTIGQYREFYKERIANNPELITYEVKGTDRKIAGTSIHVSSKDGMDLVTHLILIEELDGIYYEYRCAYVNQTYTEGAYEDETTYFHFLHAIETMKRKEAYSSQGLSQIQPPQEGELLVKALSDQHMEYIEEDYPVKIEIRIDRGGDLSEATIKDKEIIRELVDAFSKIRIGKQTWEVVTDNYNNVVFTFSDGTEVIVSLNLKNLELPIDHSYQYYELDEFGEFWNKMVALTSDK
ncbi:MAG: hypothetical protein SOZ59_10340, partial [Candidatus Limivivens sp.]|nr:hypothetical protein [Candidatus Limivivens sp.]